MKTEGCQCQQPAAEGLCACPHKKAVAELPHTHLICVLAGHRQGRPAARSMQREVRQARSTALHAYMRSTKHVTMSTHPKPCSKHQQGAAHRRHWMVCQQKLLSISHRSPELAEESARSLTWVRGD